MRMILILVALLIVGLLVSRQLNHHTLPAPEQVRQDSGVTAPKVPTQVAEVPKFEQDFNTFVEESEANRKRQLEQQE